MSMYFQLTKSYSIILIYFTLQKLGYTMNYVTFCVSFI